MPELSEVFCFALWVKHYIQVTPLSSTSSIFLSRSACRTGGYRPTDSGGYVATAVGKPPDAVTYQPHSSLPDQKKKKSELPTLTIQLPHEWKQSITGQQGTESAGRFANGGQPVTRLTAVGSQLPELGDQHPDNGRDAPNARILSAKISRERMGEALRGLERVVDCCRLLQRVGEGC